MSDLIKLFLLPLPLFLPLFVIGFAHMVKKVGIKDALAVTLCGLSALAAIAFFVWMVILLMLAWVEFVISL